MPTYHRVAPPRVSVKRVEKVVEVVEEPETMVLEPAPRKKVRRKKRSKKV